MKRYVRWVLVLLALLGCALLIIVCRPRPSLSTGRLEDLLDVSQPAVEAVAEVARAQGLHHGLQALRSHHKKVSPQPFARNPFSPVSGNLRRRADTVLQKGFRKGESHREYFPLTCPVDWTADPYGDRSWRFWLNAWIFLDPVLAGYEQLGRAEYMAFARQIALDWISQNIDGETGSEFAWYDAGVGLRAPLLAQILDDSLRDPKVPDEALLQLLRAARVHALELADPEKLASHSNHGLFQLAGLLALARTVPELRDSRLHQQYAAQELRQLAQAHFSKEGIHLEHSPYYHLLVVKLLQQLMETGWLSQQKELIDLIAKASRNTIWMIHPNGTLVRLGDTDLNKAADRLGNAESAEVEFVLSRGRSGTEPASTFAVFPESGYAAIRGPWSHRPWGEASFLFFSAAFHSRTHKHADEFTFEWSELGQVLVMDSGKYAYFYDDPKRQYVESTRSHNTVEIDGRDYSRYRLDAFGSAIKSWGEEEGVYFVEAQLFRKRFFATNHRRVLVYKPRHWLVVIDQLDSDQERTFTQWFHFNPQFEMERRDDRLVGSLPGTEKVLVVMPLLHNNKLSRQVVKGQEEPRLQGWTSLQANALIPNYAAGYTVRAQTATFVTLLQLSEQGAVPVPGATGESDDGRYLKVRWSTEGTDHAFRLEKNDSGTTLRVLP